MDKKTVDSHLGLFRSLSQQELADAEARASRRFRDAPVSARIASAEEAASGRTVRGWRLGLIGVAATVVFTIFVRMPASLDAPAVLEDVGGSRKIEFGEVVRSGDVAGSALMLADRSRVEMRAKSELSLERVADGVRIRLSKGGIIVNAAKQGAGHLYVQTKDMMVSVVGTVFLVNAEEDGSRVAVIEGEVRVTQGTTEKSLRPGEQVTTNPTLPSASVKDEISWSKNADAHMALLQQSASPAAARGDREVRLAFDVASIRPGSPSAGGGRGSNGAYPPACGGSPPTIDPGRFAVTNATLYRLITMAYGKECASVEASESELLSGGPDWIRSDKFDVETLMPKGFPTYTRQQLSTGNAPNLQAMLQTLLADRFHLVMHHEVRELPVYVLTLGKGPSKLVEWKDGEPTKYVVSTGLNANGQISTAIGGNKRSMAELAQQLMSVTRRPVLDRTGIGGEFNYSFEFEPPDSPGVREMRATGRWTFVTGPSLFTALGIELGLELKAAREKVEVLLIERAEKPTEN